MGLFSKFKKKKDKEELPSGRSESILTPEAQADQAKVSKELQGAAPDSPEEQKRQKFQELSPRIYPFFCPPNTPPCMRFETGGRNIDIPVPCAPFFRSKIFFVEDTGSSFRIVQKTEIPENISIPMLLGLSVHNLEQNVKFQVRVTDFGCILIGNPNHVSSFLLSKRLWKELAKKFDDNLLLSVPVRHAIVFIPQKRAKELLPKMNEACVKLIQEAEKPRIHPLAPVLFYFNREKEQLLPCVVQKSSTTPTIVPKPEQTAEKEDNSGEPLQEVIPKEKEDAASNPPHLRIVPKPEEEKKED
jgi:hypothetical protein